eukprot:comp18079_c1_seq1/m.31664 comp18079_c1_seq1/g.31664  ORF comp18079_c1_seq1/g.31664 comp18079_c1_seq1/m.31664 type:complete len:102 (-) comp18079_c1_seq1:28-333(-)
MRRQPAFSLSSSSSSSPFPAITQHNNTHENKIPDNNNRKAEAIDVFLSYPPACWTDNWRQRKAIRNDREQQNKKQNTAQDNKHNNNKHIHLLALMNFSFFA